MGTPTRVTASAFAASLLLAGATVAQVPRVLFGELQCIPREQHAVAQAIAGPLGAGNEVRVYFRRQGYGDFYWVPARPTSDGRYWAVLPLPEPDNHQAEVYAGVTNSTGQSLAQSPVRIVPVQSDCRTQLDTPQTADATHLVVGESSLGQKYRKVAWWRCEGIRERVDVRGERRDDDACAPIANWWERPEMLSPLVLIAGGGVTTTVVTPTPPPELSQANP